jgi:hypothetical protein
VVRVSWFELRLKDPLPQEARRPPCQGGQKAQGFWLVCHAILDVSAFDGRHLTILSRITGSPGGSLVRRAKPDFVPLGKGDAAPFAAGGQIALLSSSTFRQIASSTPLRFSRTSLFLNRRNWTPKDSMCSCRR